jgi:hypothetical protein
LSVEALHPSVRPDCVTADAARFVGVDGDVVSAHPVVATMTVVLAERLFAASRASIASV